MSVNFGAGLAPAPNNPNANDAPTPPHPVAPPPHLVALPNAPIMGVVAAAASPLEAPVGGDAVVSSTQPTLNARQSLAVNLKKLRDEWNRVEKAILEGDLKLVHRMLDEGLVPCVNEGNDGCGPVYISMPGKLFRHLQDIDLFDRFIDLFTRHSMQEDLYLDTIQAGNAILLRRLIQSGVEGWQDYSSQVEGLMISSIIRGDAKQVDACFQLTKEAYPNLKLTWSDIWRDSLKSMTYSPSAEVVAVLIRYLKHPKLSNASLVEMFKVAAEAGDHRLVSSMLAWLGGSIGTFVGTPLWRQEQPKFLPETLATLLKGGFPQQAISLPSPEKPNAQALQIVLYGPQLSTSPFAKMLVSAGCSSNKIMNFIFCTALDVEIGPFPGKLPKRALVRHQGSTTKGLFQNGLAAPLAIKIAQKMSDYLSLCKHSFKDSAPGLPFLACLSECLHPDAVAPLQDQLSIEQATIIRDASLAVLEEQFGGPIGFYGRILACIELDGSVNTKKLRNIYQHDVGLPANIVAQIGTTLKALCVEVMASAVPSSLIKPGMTGADLQAAFHRWIQQGVAQLMINRLPQDLRLNIAKHDWNKVRDDSDSDSDDDDKINPVALAELVSPINYLVTSVISQYGELLAENIEANSTAMVEACRALPADAFKQSAFGDSELSSDDEDSSSSES